MRRSHVTAYFLIAFVFLYLRTFFLPGIPLAANGDEVLFFAHGLRILQGQIPYVGYEGFVMPGTDLFYAAAFDLFGVHAWLAQAFSILLGLTLAALLLSISSRIFDTPTAYLPGLLFLVLDFNAHMDATHHWFSDLFVLAAVAVLLRGKAPRAQRHVVAAGLLCGVAAVFTQSQGLLEFFAVGLWLWHTGEDRIAKRLRSILTLAMALVAVVGSVLAWMVYRAGVATTYFSLVTFPIHYFSTLRAETAAGYFEPFPSGSALPPYLFVHFMLPFGYIWALARLWRERGSMDPYQWRAILLVTLSGLTLFAAIANAAIAPRMLMVAPPAAVVCVWLTTNVRLRSMLWAITVFGLVALPLMMQLQWRGYLDLPIGRAAFTQPSKLAEIQWLSQHTKPGESALLHPQANFLLMVENPTTVDFLLPAEYTTREQVQRAVAGLEAHHTAILILQTPQGEIRAAGHPGNNLGPLYAYAQSHYHLTKVFPAFQVWERNQP